MIRFFRNLIPKISETEKAALFAGTIGIDRNIISGNLTLDYLKNKYNLPSLTEKEQDFVKNDLDDLLKNVDDWKINQDKHIPDNILQKTKEKGLFGMIIPKEYKGTPFNAHARCKIVEKIGSRSIFLSNTVMVPNSLGPGELLLKYGTDNQKKYFLPKLSTGEFIPCFGLTGIKSGSDAANMEDIGTVIKRDGKLFIELNCNKRYITLAPISNLVGLAFKLKDPNNLLNKVSTNNNIDQSDLGITLALVEPDKTGNLNNNKRHYPIGSCFYNGPLKAQNYEIPIENIIGGNDGIGKGWNMLMECLSEGRAISLPSIATLSSYKSAFVVGAYTQARKQFKIPLYKMEGVQSLMGDVARNSYINLSAQALTNAIVENGEKPSVISAIMKERTTHLARDALNNAMDICAGWAVVQGPNNVIGMDWNSIPVAITVEGSNVLTKNLIVFGQGLLRSHYNLLDTINHIEEGNLSKVITNGLSIVSESILQTLKVNINNLIDKLNFLKSNQNDLLNMSNNKVLNYYDGVLNNHSSSLSILSNLSLFLGGTIKSKQFISGRCAEIFGNTYLAYACIWRYSHLDNIDKSLYRPQLVSALNYLLNENVKNFKKLKENSSVYTLLSIPNTENNKNYDKVLKKSALSLVDKRILNHYAENLHFKDQNEDMMYNLKKYVNTEDEALKKVLEDKIIHVSEFNIN